MRTQMVSKLAPAAILTAIAVGALWIEHGHRIIIEPPAPAEFVSPAPAAPCPDSDNVPYSASCLRFLGTGYASSMSWKRTVVEGVATPVSIAR
jgi:hypothetical protein